MNIEYLIVFFISMIPVIELRVAVPLGITMGLNPIYVYILCIIGNMLPVPMIYFFARKFLIWGKNKPYIGWIFTFLLDRGERAGKKITARAGKGLFFALVLFVGIPVPGTGAWTGTLAASILDIDFKTSVLACTMGILLAGVIMGIASLGVISL